MTSSPIEATPSNKAAANCGIRELFARANQAHSTAVAAANNAIQYAMTAGDLLTEAKKRSKHGDWESWVKRNCDFSLRTAQSYIRLAKSRATIESKAQTSALLKIDDAIKLIAGPSRPRQPSPAELPDLTSDAIFVAPGVGNTVVQLEPSGRHPGYHYVTFANFDTGELVEVRRPINLGIVRLPSVLGTLCFNQDGAWQPCRPEEAPIPLVKEGARFAAYLAALNGTP